MSQIKRFSAFLLLTVIILVGCMLISSSPLIDLEKDIITKSEVKVVTVAQIEFGKGGIVLVGTDKSGAGVLKAYSKIPILSHYVEIGKVDFKNENKPVTLVGESWAGYQLLTYQNGGLNSTDARGMGFGRRVMWWFGISVSAACLIDYGPVVARNIRTRKKENN